MQMSWIYAGCAALCLLPTAQAQDLQPIYKCENKGVVTYSHVACSGAKIVGAPAAKPAASRQPVVSDRAKLHARGQLPAEVRQECTELDGKIAAEQVTLKDKGAAATPAEEGVLVRLRIKSKELGC